jgi:hypothetical protein
LKDSEQAEKISQNAPKMNMQIAALPNTPACKLPVCGKRIGPFALNFNIKYLAFKRLVG